MRADVVNGKSMGNIRGNSNNSGSSRSSNIKIRGDRIKAISVHMMCTQGIPMSEHCCCMLPFAKVVAIVSVRFTGKICPVSPLFSSHSLASLLRFYASHRDCVSLCECD